MLILGIESSCDETAAAVVRDGREILSSVISSQIEMHKPFGGVVPELASREHLEKIEPIVSQALERAGVTVGQIEAIAVTQGPGLIGSLLVGVCYAKALAFGLGIPIVGVNHIEGHVFSVIFENPDVEYPALALIVSGGHTNLFYVPEPGKYKVVVFPADGYMVDKGGFDYDLEIRSASGGAAPTAEGGDKVDPGLPAGADEGVKDKADVAAAPAEEPAPPPAKAPAKKGKKGKK